MPTILNIAASTPVRVRSLVPSPSSVILISATFIAVVVSAFSARVVVTPVKVIVGASFISVMVIARAAKSSGVAGKATSST